MRVWKLLAAFVFAGLFITPVFADTCDDLRALGVSGPIMLSNSADSCVVRSETADVNDSKGYCHNCYNSTGYHIYYNDGLGHVPIDYHIYSDSIFCTNCSYCAPGYVITQGSAPDMIGTMSSFCAECIGGTYKEGTSSETLCTPCPPGGTSDFASTSPSSCYKDCSEINDHDGIGNYSISAARVYWQ